MNTEASPNTTDDAMLSELAGLGMGLARAITRAAQIEQAAADVVAAWLPAPGAEPGSAEAASEAGMSVDAVCVQMAGTVPRLDALARAFERVSRAVRRCIALRQRVEAGWPRARSTDTADDRAAMVRRQVTRGVAEAIRRETARTTDQEAAERLFDDLAERLDDPELEQAMAVLPVDEVVRRVCRDLGLAEAAVRAVGVSPGGGGRDPVALPRHSREPPSG